MLRIGVVGDIHGNYPGLKKALAQMGTVDHLLFTGDGIRDIRHLQAETGVFVRGVRGNCDFLADFPDEELFTLEGNRILLTHGHHYNVKNGLTRIGLAAQEKEVRMVVFGHTHLPVITEWQGILLLNPGTLCRERCYNGIGYGMIEVSENGLRPALYRL